MASLTSLINNMKKYIFHKTFLFLPFGVFLLFCFKAILKKRNVKRKKWFFEVNREQCGAGFCIFRTVLIWLSFLWIIIMSQRGSNNFKKKENKPTYKVLLSLPSLPPPPPPQGQDVLLGFPSFHCLKSSEQRKYFFQNPISDHPACSRALP